MIIYADFVFDIVRVKLKRNKICDDELMKQGFALLILLVLHLLNIYTFIYLL
jgi:hypothetical protein